MAVISNFILHDNFFFQHYLILLGSNLATPGLLATIICAEGNIEVTSIMLGNMLFACGNVINETECIKSMSYSSY
jgi:hypothetical protein